MTLKTNKKFKNQQEKKLKVKIRNPKTTYIKKSTSHSLRNIKDTPSYHHTVCALATKTIEYKQNEPSKRRVTRLRDARAVFLPLQQMSI